MLQLESDQLIIFGIYHPLDLLLDTSLSSQALHQQVMIIYLHTWWFYVPPVPDPPLKNACASCFGGIRVVITNFLFSTGGNSTAMTTCSN